MTNEVQSSPFIGYLVSLSDNRAAMASLRRGLGKKPGSVPDMYPYVAIFINDDTPPWVESSFYLVAALFGRHPQNTSEGNMGSHFKSLLGPDSRDSAQAIERRFNNLLSCHTEELAFHMRQAISLLASSKRTVPVNYSQLMKDIWGWGHRDKYVQQRWARSFWGGRKKTDEAKTE